MRNVPSSPTHESENNFLVSDSAQESLSKVKLKHPSEVTVIKGALCSFGENYHFYNINELRNMYISLTE